MPTMQEQLSAMAMDGLYADNAGAVFGDGHGWPVCRQRRSSFRRWPWMACMPAMQERLQAMAMEPISVEGVVIHMYVNVNRDALADRSFSKAIRIALVVLRLEETRLSIIAALNEVLRDIRGIEARLTRNSIYRLVLNIICLCRSTRICSETPTFSVRKVNSEPPFRVSSGVSRTRTCGKPGIRMHGRRFCPGYGGVGSNPSVKMPSVTNTVAVLLLLPDW